jgi:hypothetical protein
MAAPGLPGAHLAPRRRRALDSSQQEVEYCFALLRDFAPQDRQGVLCPMSAAEKSVHRIVFRRRYRGR